MEGGGKTKALAYQAADFLEGDPRQNYMQLICSAADLHDFPSDTWLVLMEKKVHRQDG